MTNRALVHSRAVTVHPPEGFKGEPFLVVQLRITCDICGDHEFVLAGHHLRPIVASLQEIIDAEPALTKEGETEVVMRRQGETTFRPEDN